jgi:hypothetical protein
VIPSNPYTPKANTPTSAPDENRSEKPAEIVAVKQNGIKGEIRQASFSIGLDFLTLWNI